MVAGYTNYPVVVTCTDTEGSCETGGPFVSSILQEVFQNKSQKALVWMDPFFRPYRADWMHVFTTAVRNGGLYIFKCLGIPGFISTHPNLYKFFPVNVNKYKQVPDYWDGGIYLFKSEMIYRDFLYWWLLCALDQRCAQPINEYGCSEWYHWSDFVDRKNPENTRWANCHRFGQSIIAILIDNMFGYRGDFYHWDKLPVVDRIHHPTWMHDLQYCGERPTSTVANISNV